MAEKINAVQADNIEARIRDDIASVTPDEVASYVKFRCDLAVQEALSSESVKKNDELIEAQKEVAHAQAMEAQTRLQMMALEAVERAAQNG